MQSAYNSNLITNPDGVDMYFDMTGDEVTENWLQGSHFGNQLGYPLDQQPVVETSHPGYYDFETEDEFSCQSTEQIVSPVGLASLNKLFSPNEAETETETEGEGEMNNTSTADKNPSEYPILHNDLGFAPEDSEVLPGVGIEAGVNDCPRFSYADNFPGFQPQLQPVCPPPPNARNVQLPPSMPIPMPMPRSLPLHAPVPVSASARVAPVLTMDSASRTVPVSRDWLQVTAWIPMPDGYPYHQDISHISYPTTQQTHSFNVNFNLPRCVPGEVVDRNVQVDVQYCRLQD